MRTSLSDGSTTQSHTACPSRIRSSLRCLSASLVAIARGLLNFTLSHVCLSFRHVLRTVPLDRQCNEILVAGLTGTFDHSFGKWPCCLTLTHHHDWVDRLAPRARWNSNFNVDDW